MFPSWLIPILPFTCLTWSQQTNFTINLATNVSVILDILICIHLGTMLHWSQSTLNPSSIGTDLPILIYTLISSSLGTNLAWFIVDLNSRYVDTKRPIYQGTNLPRSIGVFSWLTWPRFKASTATSETEVSESRPTFIPPALIHLLTILDHHTHVPI